MHLEKVVAAMEQSFRAVALLPPQEQHLLFASTVGEGATEVVREGKEDDALKLHALIEEGGSSESIR